MAKLWILLNDEARSNVAESCDRSLPPLVRVRERCSREGACVVRDGATGREDQPEFRRAVSLMAHIVAARRIWLSRLGVIAAAGGSPVSR